ncbi:MAG: MoaD/ThiS family protein [Candidatus Asgardarchaeia archaeon]
MRIKVIGYLSEIIGFKEMNLEIKNPLKISRVIDVEKLREKGVREDRIIILVNGKPSGVDHILKDEDVVVIMPVVGGG